MVIERLSMLINGMDPGMIAEIYDNTDEMLELDDLNEDLDAEEVNIDFDEYVDTLEQIDELDMDSILGKLTEVEYGCKIHIRKLPENTFFISSMPLAGGRLNAMQKWFLGKSIGSTWRHGGSIYEIVDIGR